MKNYKTLVEALATSLRPLISKSIYHINPNIDYSALRVVFEFECYLSVEKPSYSDRISGSSMSIDDISPSEYADILKAYFNISRLQNRKMKAEYYRWAKKKILAEVKNISDMRFKQEIETRADESEESLEELIDEYENNWEISIDDFLAKRFSTFFKVIDWLDATPVYGWVNDEPGRFYAEEPELEDANNADFYEQFLEHSFFADKKVEVLRQYHQVSKSPDTWYIEPDSSLTDSPDEGDYVPVEIVSAWIPGDKVLNALEDFRDFYEYFNGVTNESTGFHINIRFAKNEPINENFDWLKLLILAQDQQDLRAFAREDNAYARQVLEKMRTDMQDIPKTLTKETLPQFEKALRDSFYPEKYDAISFNKFFFDRVSGESTKRHGFIEFRGPGNDYLDSRFVLSKKTTIKFMNLMFMTQNSEYHKEYIVRLHRLYQSLLKVDMDDPTPLFLKKILSTINKSFSLSQLYNELNHFVRQAKTPKRPDTIRPISEKIYELFSNFHTNRHAHNFLTCDDEVRISDRNLWVLAILYYIIHNEKVHSHIDIILTKLEQIAKNSGLPISVKKTFEYLLGALGISSDDVPESIQTHFYGDTSSSVLVTLINGRPCYMPTAKTIRKVMSEFGEIAWMQGTLKKLNTSVDALENTEKMRKENAELNALIERVEAETQSSGWFIPTTLEFDKIIIKYLAITEYGHVDEDSNNFIKSFNEYLKTGSNYFWTSSEISDHLAMAQMKDRRDAYPANKSIKNTIILIRYG